MPHYKRGQLQFEHKTAGTIDGSEDVVEMFFCDPPPLGTRLGASPVVKYGPFQPKKFLQPDEIKRIEKFAANTGETLSIKTVQQELIAAFKIKPLEIDLKIVPQKWRRADKCGDVKITVQVRSKILTIDAVAAKDLTLDKVTWPKGDSLASFRIIVPDQYMFYRRKTHNEKCCPLKEGEKPLIYVPEEEFWTDPQFVDYSGLKGKTGWKLGLEYEMDGLKLKPEYGFGGGMKYIPFDPEEEDLPPKPWITPRIGF